MQSKLVFLDRITSYNVCYTKLLRVLLNGQDEVHVGERVYGTGRVVEVPVGDELLGRVVSPIGLPMDNKPLNAKRYRPVESPAPRIIDRQAVNHPLMTGLIV